MGDPAGIGPEICLRALREPSVLKLCTPVLFGDAGVIKRLSNKGFSAPKCKAVSLAEWKKLGRVERAVDC